MIDGIKFRLPKEYVEIIKNNPRLDLTGKYKLKNGNGIPDKFRAEYKCFTIDVYKEVVRVRGSIHKYYQKGTNYDNFSFNSICKAIHQLCDELEINPDDCILENLEFGLNIPTSFNVTSWLKVGIIAFRKFKPRRLEDHKTKGYYIEFESKKYWRVKIYDKGRQYGLDTETIRIEKKIMNNCDIQKKLNISVLSDLLDKRVYQSMQLEIQKVLNGLICIDNSDINKVAGKKNRNFMLKAINSSFWVELNSEQRRTSKKRFKALCAKYKLDSKLHELANKSQKIWAVLLDEHINATLPKGVKIHRLSVDNQFINKNYSEINYKNKYENLKKRNRYLWRELKRSRLTGARRLRYTNINGPFNY